MECLEAVIALNRQTLCVREQFETKQLEFSLRPSSVSSIIDIIVEPALEPRECGRLSRFRPAVFVIRVNYVDRNAFPISTAELYFLHLQDLAVEPFPDSLQSGGVSFHG